MRFHLSSQGAHDFPRQLTCSIMEKMKHQPVDKPINPTKIPQVRRALEHALPGLPAQLRMAPAYPTHLLRDRSAPPDAKDAAVLVLFYRHHDQLYFPLTRRTDTLESHRGQISLPGGAREGEESLKATALRETCEELAACADNWLLLGRLTPLYVSASEYVISPFVAYVAERPEFVPDPVEVAELIETPLALLLNPATVKREEWELRGTRVNVPFYDIMGHKVWGATAMILSELVALLREVPS
jgi:8-oxo-dGTP pyrophosphatase MutT (NUDIX family)